MLWQLRRYNAPSKNPKDEVRAMIVRLRFLKMTYGITESDIYDLRWYLNEFERGFMTKKPTMNEDILKYPIFIFRKGKLIETELIKSTDDYNHYVYNLHHFIPKQQYEKDKQWYEDRGIKQKLILVPISMHEQIHNQSVHNLEDDDFYG